jgi:hypothetical protein
LQVVPSGVVDLKEGLVGRVRELDDRRLSHGLLTGLLLLALVPDDGSLIGVAQLARLAGMNTSTTHRYLSTFVAAGIMERDHTTRHYRLAL